MINTLNIAQIAKIAKLSPTSLHGKARREKLGLPKQVAPRRWRTEEVMAWLRDRQKGKKA